MSLTIVGPVSCCHELETDFLHFLKKSNFKKFCICRVHFQVRYQKIASSTQRKRLAVVFDFIFLANRDLPLPPNVQAHCFSCFKMAQQTIEITKTKKCKS